MIIFTALPLIRAEVWWIRIFDFPRLQIAVVAAITLAVYLLFIRDPDLAALIFVILLSLCVLYQMYMMFPYTRLAGKQVQQSKNETDETSVSLFTANVLQDNRSSNTLIEILRKADPDIILTVETDNWWREQLKEFEKTHPFVVHQPQDNTYGMMLYSKLELVQPEVKFLIQEDVPSIHSRVRLRSGKEIELRCLHPRPPFPTEDESSLGRDAEILTVGKENKESKRPFVVMGDLNDVAWSRTNYLFQDISGLLDPRVGRGFFHTFHAEFPLLRVPLDHFFHSNHFRLVDFRRLGYFGSDHFPVYIKLSYEPDAAQEQLELEADQSQEEDAREKIAKAT